MSLTVANAIGTTSGSNADSSVEFGEHLLSQREVLGGELGRQAGVLVDHRVGERRMLADGPLPDLGGVWLGIEAEADLAADVRGQGDKPLVVRCPGNRLVQRMVGQVRGFPVRRLRV